LHRLEEEGDLGPKALSLFSRLDSVESLQLGPSYAPRGTSEIGLPKASKYPPLKVTALFYAKDAFEGLRILDLTHVPIQDDDLRYLIRLKGLQALGLSGTNIGNAGIRYLSKHAEFRQTLQCMKLCYLEKLADHGVRALSAFFSLVEVDLLGSDGVTLDGVLAFASESLRKLRLPSSVQSRLTRLHDKHLEIARKHGHRLLQTEAEIDQLGHEDVRMQLKFYCNVYPDVFLSAEPSDMKTKLRDIVQRRKKELLIWSAL